jgi:hypothetical protein
MLTAYAIRAGDRALLELVPERIDIAMPELLAHATRCDDQTLLVCLPERAWRVAIGGAVFELRHRCSAFRLTADVHEARCKDLLRSEGAHPLEDALLRERRIVRAARVLLHSMLDADAVRCLRRAGAEVNATTYNWLVLGGAKRRWREQAVQAYPGLISALLLDDPRTHDWPTAEDAATAPAVATSATDLTSIVDRGAPLTAWLAAHLRQPEEVVRHFRGVPARRLVVSDELTVCSAIGPGEVDIRAMAAVLAVLPVQRRPRTAMEWRWFQRLAGSLKPLSAAFALLPRDAWERFKATGLRRFLLLDAPRQRAILPLWTEVDEPHRPALRGIEDFVGSLCRVARQHGVMVDPIASALADRSVAELVALNRGWHDAVVECQAAGPGLVDGEVLHWPALLSELRTPARNLLELTSSDQLQEEGDQLEHCVGTWTSHCMFGRTHVFSIRDHAGRRCSTLALRLEPDARGGLRATIAEHRAFRNGTPSPECRAAAKALIQAAADVDLRPLEAALEDRLARQPELTRGLDVTLEAHALRCVLPEGLRRVLWPIRGMQEPDRV